MRTNGRRPDRLGLGRLQIYQDESIFKFTIDPILAAGFLRARSDERILDLGTGGGVIPLWLAGYRNFRQLTGLELQPEVADLARENVALNELGGRIRIVTGDLREPPSELKEQPFPWIVTNPPYFPASSLLSGNIALDRAKFELTCTLEDLIYAARLLTPGNGRLVMVHLPERLPDIIVAMRKQGFEPKLLRMVHPRPSQPPNRILIEGQRGAKPHLRIMSPLFIRNESGEGFSEEMQRIYEGE